MITLHSPTIPYQHNLIRLVQWLAYTVLHYCINTTCKDWFNDVLTQSYNTVSTQPDRTGSMITLHSPTLLYQHNLIGLVQ